VCVELVVNSVPLPAPIEERLGVEDVTEIQPDDCFIALECVEVWLAVLVALLKTNVLQRTGTQKWWKLN
jgi:hypothetical protein